ncbi:unnamed protein product [Microthlaspi erraticum]|uniref:Myb/SANT-like domain-containing protein n=1 Tax=Microthlaspi erraticum TaxID=1685480 RepID=A0A6D2HHZ4_9BRAS|nr:unnamed protein product [Microthlaspi erraticum]
MKFPLPFLLLKFATEWGVGVSQLTHGVFRHMVFTDALAAAADIMFDRHLFENVTDLRAGSKWEGIFKQFHTAIRHRIARPSSALKGKFKALRELSHQIWPEVVEELEGKKKERKEKKEGRSKPAVSATPLSVKPPYSKKKPMGIKKRAPVSVDDAVVASKPAPKKRKTECPKPKNSLSPPLPSSSIASRTKASSRARHARGVSSSTAEKAPKSVINVDSPPAAEQERCISSKRGCIASRRYLGTPPCGGVSPT